MKPPKRRNQITIEIGTDDHDAIVGVLYDLAARCEAKEILIAEGSGTAGGTTYGYSYSMTVDPDMDGGRYREALEKWQEVERGRCPACGSLGGKHLKNCTWLEP